MVINIKDTLDWKAIPLILIELTDFRCLGLRDVSTVNGSNTTGSIRSTDEGEAQSATIGS
jgi:hypothetical protein